MSDSQIYTYRIYCVTDSKWVYQKNYSSTTTAVCFENSEHTVDENSLEVFSTNSNRQTFISNIVSTGFNELITVNKTNLLNLKSSYGKSTLYDHYTEEGTGTITNNIGDGAYILSVSAADDRVVLRSRQRVNYLAGTESECGIAALLSQSSLSGNQFCKFGLFTDTEGFYFKHTPAGLSIVILENSVETEIQSTHWNYDQMDGTGPSKNVFDVTRPLIFKFVYSLQGCGCIKFYINTVNSVTKLQSSWLIHQYVPTALSYIKNPNLPISVEVDNNGTAGSLNVKIAERECAVFGFYNKQNRIVHDFRTAVDTSTTFAPIFTIRKKTNYEGIKVKLQGLDMTAATSMFIEIRRNCSLTGASFGNLTNVSATNTAVEIDRAATALTGGDPLFAKLINSGDTTTISLEDSEIVLNEYDTITICAREVTATLGATITGIVFRWLEGW